MAAGVSSSRPQYFWSTMGFLYAVCVIEGLDIHLLPCSFRALERTLGLTPSDLAKLGLAQALTQCTIGPVWAALADNGVSRRNLLIFGVTSWAALTLGLGLVENLYMMVWLRLLNGAALSSLLPISQSIIADVTQPEERGFFFGVVQFFLTTGVLIGQLFGTTISNTTIYGMAGWRVAFISVAGMSFLLAILIACFMHELPRSQIAESASLSASWQKLVKYLQIPTFRYLVAQGAFGCIPWSAMTFMTMFYQYVGMSDLQAASTASAGVVGNMIGGMLGGVVGDALTRWSRFHGRPLTAQISVLSGIPFIVMILQVVPRNPSSYQTYVCLMFSFTLLASWCGVGVNRPILTEIAGSSDRASIVAWMVAFEGSFGACFGAPFVGYLADNVFGYEAATVQVADMPTVQREQNAEALAHAMLFLTSIPWVICFLFYTMTHFTYRADIARAGIDAKEGDAKEISPLAAKMADLH